MEEDCTVPCRVIPAYRRSAGSVALLFFVGLASAVNAGWQEAQQEALAAYKKAKDPGAAITRLESAGIREVLKQKPSDLKESSYVSLLNDYGYYLSESLDRWEEAITILEKVIALSPSRHVAYLNLGDTYQKSLQKTSDTKRQQELKVSVKRLYEEYARILKEKSPALSPPLRVREVLSGATAPSREQSPREERESNRTEVALATQIAPGLERVAVIDEFQIDYPVKYDDGHLIFTRYDKSGNGKELVFYNVAEQRVTLTLGGFAPAGVRHLYSDGTYIIVLDLGWPNAVVVYERKQVKPIKKLKLNQRITGAFIREGKLYITQNDEAYHVHRGGTGLIYDLKTMKQVGSGRLIGNNASYFYGEMILAVGYEAKLYSLEFKEVGSFRIPPRNPERTGGCEIGPVRIALGRLILGAPNCGDILIYDIGRRQLETVIPSFDPAYFVSFDVTDGLVFATPTTPNNTRVFDLHTGRELALLPITAGFIAADRDRLFTVRYEQLIFEKGKLKTSPITLYRFQKEQMLAKESRHGQILEAHKRANSIVEDTGEVYHALDLLDQAGFPALLEQNTGANAELGVVRADYTKWLSHTWDRYEESIPLIEWQIIQSPEQPEWHLLLADVYKRDFDLTGRQSSMVEASKAYERYRALVPTGRSAQVRDLMAVKPNLTTAHSREVNIASGSLSEAIFFHEDRAYLGLYDCLSWARITDSPGVKLQVYDRNAFTLLHSVEITGCDDDYQDNIGQIRFSPHQIFLDMGYRYESEDRPDLVVLDKKTLEVLVKMRRPGNRQDNGAWPATSRVEAVNDKYIITNTGRYPTRQLHVKAVTDGREWDLSLPTADQGQPFFLGHPDHLLLVSGSRFVFYDLGTNKALTVARLKPQRNHETVVATYGSLAFVGMGHDLLIIDGSTKRIAHVEKNIITQTFEDNGHGLDKNRIAMLFVEGDRLIARTFYGGHSRILALPAATKTLGIAVAASEGQSTSSASAVLLVTPANKGSQVLALEEDMPLASLGSEEGRQHSDGPIRTLVEPSYISAMAELASAEAEVGRPASAKETLRSAQAAAGTLLKPEHRLDAYVNLAKILADLKETEGTLNLIKEARGLIETDATPSVAIQMWPKIALAYAALAGEEHRSEATKAGAKARELLSSANDYEKLPVLLELAQVEHALHNDQAALRLLDQAFTSPSATSAYPEAKAQALLQTANVQGMIVGRDAALKTLAQGVQATRGISSKTTRVQAYAAMAGAQARWGDKKAAQTSLVEAERVGATIKKDSNQDRVAAALAQARAELGDFNAAERLVSTNHTGTFLYREAFFAIAVREAQAGDVQGALRMVRKHGVLSPIDSLRIIRTQIEIARGAFRTGQKEEALDMLEGLHDGLPQLEVFH